MAYWIRFDSLPGPKGCRFIELEDEYGRGVGSGKWEKDGADYLLKLPDETAELRAENERLKAAHGSCYPEAWKDTQANLELQISDLRAQLTLAKEALAALEAAKRALTVPDASECFPSPALVTKLIDRIRRALAAIEKALKS
jgi:hypothetical protein